MRSLPALLTAAVVLTSGIASSLVQAQLPSPPPFHAILDVTVVTGTGKTMEGATVLVADGLIEAVGTGIAVPADAWVTDGKGLILYPGLVDALTTLGLKQEDGGGAGRAGGGPGSPGSVVRGPEDRPQTSPWAAAADALADDGRIEKWRKAGFTAAVTAPDGGLFAGQAAYINLGGSEELSEPVVATPVAQRLNLRSDGGFRAFPGSLMGVLAYIKQVFTDTRHYQQAQQAYASAPQGRERPAYDRTLETLGHALQRKTPFLLPAHLGREIDRALQFSREFELPAIVYGGQGAYARVDALKAAGTPVLVSLNWPKEEKDRDPDADTPFRTHYHRRLAPTTPARLAAAGVPFAFYADGLALPAEILKNVRQAVDAGLSHEDALAGLTAGPARIFGVAAKVGTIENGKIANLVLATDWPWAEGAEVKAVFVDGRRYVERQSEEPTEAPAADVSGSWSLTMTTPQGSQELKAELEMKEDGKTSGQITGQRGETPLEEGRLSGSLLRFKTTRSMGSRSMTAAWSLSLEGENLSGSMSAGPMSMNISGVRTAKPDKEAAGEEAGKPGESKEPAVSIAELDEMMALYQAPVSRMGSFAITNATIWILAGASIEGGTVLVKDGKISAVGQDVEVPPSVTVIDGGGGHLIPGIIDAHAHIAIEGGVNEGTLAVTSMAGIEDVLNADDIAIYRALAGGVTSANLLHGSANPIGGRNQVIKLRWGTDAAGLRFAGAPPGIKFALGENPTRANFSGIPGAPRRYPQTRMGVMDVIHEAFTEARQYQQEWQAYGKSGGAAAGRRTGGGKQRAGSALPPPRDLKLEPLVEILEGRRLVHAHSYRADEILQLLRLAEEFGFRVATLQHVLEGYKVADEIAAHGAGASTFSDWWGYKMEANDAIPYNAALMTRRGVVVSINSDSGEEMRHLNQEAAKTMKWGGLDEIEALKLVTLNPARQLGIDQRVGSIEVGKDADLVLYDRHPLSIQAVVQKTFIDGDLYFDIEADHSRQARLVDIKARLAPADKKDKKEDGTAEPEEKPAPPGAELSKPSPTVTWQDAAYSCRGEGE